MSEWLNPLHGDTNREWFIWWRWWKCVTSKWDHFFPNSNPLCRFKRTHSGKWQLHSCNVIICNCLMGTYPHLKSPSNSVIDCRWIIFIRNICIYHNLATHFNYQSLNYYPVSSRADASDSGYDCGRDWSNGYRFEWSSLTAIQRLSSWLLENVLVSQRKAYMSIDMSLLRSLVLIKEQSKYLFPLPFKAISFS